MVGAHETQHWPKPESWQLGASNALHSAACKALLRTL
jgi:hypothetical protein